MLVRALSTEWLSDRRAMKLSLDHSGEFDIDLVSLHLPLTYSDAFLAHRMSERGNHLFAG